MNEKNVRSSPELFGSMVFSQAQMRQRLPERVYDAWQQCLIQGTSLDRSIADEIAAAMKDWAIEKVLRRNPVIVRFMINRYAFILFINMPVKAGKNIKSVCHNSPSCSYICTTILRQRDTQVKQKEDAKALRFLHPYFLLVFHLFSQKARRRQCEFLLCLSEMLFGFLGGYDNGTDGIALTYYRAYRLRLKFLLALRDRDKTSFLACSGNIFTFFYEVLKLCADRFH